MSITPGNLSMLLAIASSIAPGTWALVAGVAGVAVGFFGKQFYDRTPRANDTSNAGPLPRRNPARRTRSPIGRKKSPPAS